MPSNDAPLSQKKLHRRANSCKKEVLSQVLGSRHCAQRAPHLSKALLKGETAARTRLQSANLVGIGFGIKETKGAYTGDLAVRVYVTKKLPNDALPRQFRVPDVVNGITTDVIPVGRLKLQSRPAAVGASISHSGGGPGSLGCVVALANDNSWYLLSAAHVMAPKGIATAGDQILEPALENGGTAPIAILADFEPLRSDGPNRFDASIARVIRKTDVSLQIPVIGSPQGDVMDPMLYQSVRKYGAVTLHTLGIVTDVSCDVYFTADGEEYLFDDVVQITGCGNEFTQGGDSGALVVDAMSRRPVCLVIGGAGVRTYASPIERILTRFNAQIAQ